MTPNKSKHCLCTLFHSILVQLTSFSCDSPHFHHQETDICVRGQFEKFCQVCGEIVIGSMRTHSERSKCPGKHPCKECSTSFANKDELLKHIENVHSTITEFTVIVV